VLNIYDIVKSTLSSLNSAVIADTFWFCGSIFSVLSNTHSHVSHSSVNPLVLFFIHLITDSNILAIILDLIFIL